LRALLTKKSLRFPLIVGLGLQLAQQLSGINAVFYYSTGFFEKARFKDPWLGSVLAATVNVISTGLAVQMMDRLGRRTLLLISSTAMCLSSIALTVTLYLSADQPENVTLGYVLVICVLLFVTFFEMGLGPIPWLIVAEIFPSKARATAMTAASALNWTANFIVGITFPHVTNNLGKWSFVPFAAFLVLTTAFTTEFVFETKGKSLQEIQQEIQDRTQSKTSGDSDQYSDDYDSNYANNQLDIEE